MTSVLTVSNDLNPLNPLNYLNPLNTICCYLQRLYDNFSLNNAKNVNVNVLRV